MNRWEFSHAPTLNDDMAIGADLIDGHGHVMASCLLLSDGELDTESDGCGIFADDVKDPAWPEYADGYAVVFSGGAA